MEEINVIQGTEFAMLAASTLKEDASIKEEALSSEPRDGKGFLAVPEGEGDPSKSGTGMVKARAKLRVTFALE